MRILVLTRGCWDKNNNTGNTMDNFFSGFKDAEIHNLYFRAELPANNPCKSIYQISEQQLIKSIFKRKPCGKFVSNVDKSNQAQNSETRMYDTAKKMNLTLFGYARELIWMLGKWKSKKFEEYLTNLNPDIVFMPVYNCWYPHKVLEYIKKKTNAEVVLFHADDNYTLKQFSLSPLYWLYRFNLRKWIRKSEKISSLDYAISEIQCKEYSKVFKKEIKILYKGQHFEDLPVIKKPNGIIKMVFTGNISSGRYKSLSLIGKAINNINADERKIELDIYTTTPMTKKMKKALNIDGINFKGGVSADKIMDIQRNADILVHAEAFDKKNKLAVRQSFSTKIVDYLYNAKCIFAVGPHDVASMDYLSKNNAAVIASCKKMIEQVLKKIVENPSLICDYGENAWECGKKNHQKDNIQQELYNNFEKLLEK